MIGQTILNLHDRAPLSRRSKDARGFFVADAVLARTGIQEYGTHEPHMAADLPPHLAQKHVVRIYRSPQEVFSDASIASFAHLPVTDDHPIGNMVTTDNFKDFVVGYVPSVGKRDSFIVGKVVISAPDAISKVENGKEELSVGYHSWIDWTPGTTLAGENYDGQMRDIRANHLAIVMRGRCGAECRINDSKGTGSMCNCQQKNLGDAVVDARQKMIADMTGNPNAEASAEYHDPNAFADPNDLYVGSAEFKATPEYARLATLETQADEARSQMISANSDGGR